MFNVNGSEFHSTFGLDVDNPLILQLKTMNS